MIYALIVIVLLVQCFLFYQNNNTLLNLQKLWTDERKQLIDRIQASSFQEYKTAEIRTIKAEKDESKPKIVME